jgi:hypothetical protein
MNDSKTNPKPEADEPRMPKATEPTRVLDDVVESFAERAAALDDGRNPIFDILVRDETDLDGLVAYALYKQNKRDWLIAFEKSNGRQPEAKELASYILGERTPRRIETYRRLAGDALSHHSQSTKIGAPRLGDTAKSTDWTKPAEPQKALPSPRLSDVGPISVGKPGIEPARAPVRERSTSSLVTIVSVIVLVIVFGYLAYRFGGQVFSR